jgi:salicylate hydroxylase
MFPTTGQGGSQSLEDVCALGILLDSDTLQSKDEINGRLEVYERLRKERMAVVQGMSGVTFGFEERFARERPWHVINQVGIKSGEEHLSYLYQ